MINGNDNTVDVDKLVSIAINGNTNTVNAKGHVEQISKSGKDNKIDAGK